MKNICKYLVEMHRDFDIGNEAIMAKHGRLEGQRIVVGSCSYDTIIITPCMSLENSTVELLSEFIGQHTTLLIPLWIIVLAHSLHGGNVM